MKLPLFSWVNTLAKLGYKVKKHSRRVFNKSKLPSSVEITLDVEKLEPRYMLSVVVDFESGSNGTELTAGEIVAGQWSSDGLQISTTDQANHPAMIFSTGNITGSDSDLGTPNADFAGPGVGEGGSAGADGENANALGNVLIISEDHDSGEPNDSDVGGTFVFEFDSLVSIERLGLLDIGNDESVSIRFFNANNELFHSFDVTGLGENSVQQVAPGAFQLSRMEVSFESDGAITELVFDEVEDQVYVVDRIFDASFQYTLAGNTTGSFSISPSNESRGAATSPDGTKLFVVDASRNVYVFDTRTQSLLGSWKAKGIFAPQGIATDGENIWLVDRVRRRVHFFAGGADNLTGSQRSTSSFRLNFFNFNASGITTDGERIWVVDRGTDRVFVYHNSGGLIGSWRLDFRNRRPTGIAVDPSGGANIWVLDSQDDEVYSYANGRDLLSGYHAADSSFELDSNNRLGQGLAIGSRSMAEIPDSPTIVQISNDTGASDTDGVTNDNTITVSGTASPGNSITLFETTLGELGQATTGPNGEWVVNLTSFEFPDGEYSLFATAANSFGVSDPSTLFQLTVDTASPVNLSISRVDDDSGADDSDGWTNDTTLIASGFSEPNSLVALSEFQLGELGSVYADSLGAWSLDFTSTILGDGNYVFTATATDLAGNETVPSAPLAVVIDTLEPTRPTIDSISDDTGFSSTDGITNIPTQTILGTAEPNTQIDLIASATGSLATAFSDSNGDWSVEVTFAESNYELTAIATDRAGNASPSSLTFALVVDITTPVVPELTSIDLDSGASPNDGVTNDSTLFFHGTAEPGSQITLTEATGGLVGAVFADAFGIWEIDTTSTPLLDGLYQFSVFADDLAGNQSAASLPLAVEVDTVAPGEPAIFRIDNDTGSSDVDGVTNDATLVFTGIGVPNGRASLFETTLGFVGLATVNAAGAWSLDASSLELSEGEYEFFAIVDDLAGNTSLSSAPFNVVIDTTAPQAGTINGIDSDTGSDPHDGTTSDGTLVFHGNAEPGSLVMLTENSLGVFGNTIADPNGDWQIDATANPLVDGIYSFQVIVEDLAGNISPPSAAFDVTVDTVGPSIPSILRVDEDTGSSSSDGITNDDTLQFIGMAVPNTIVEIFEVTLGSLGTAITDAAGFWSIDATATPLADGAYEFYATATDLAGNVSTSSITLHVLVDTSAPWQPTIIGIAQDTGSDPFDGITNDNQISIFGTAEAFSLVSVSDSTVGDVGSVTADHNGDWQLTMTTAILVDGVYNFVASSTDTAGNSSASSSYQVEIDTVAPATPTIAGVSEDTGMSPVDGVTFDAELVISGLAEATSIVGVFDDSGLIGTAVADSSGNWSLDASDNSFADGSYSLIAIATDLAGNASSDSEAFIVIIDTLAPQTPTLDLDPDFDTLPIGDQATDEAQVSLIGVTEPGASVELVETGQVVLADASGDFSFSNVDLAIGPNDFTVVASDLAGNVSSFVQTITNTMIDEDSPLVTVQLANDTGPFSNDFFTTEPDLVGLVIDASPVTVEFGLYSVVMGIDYIADVSNELAADGSFTLDQTFLDGLVGGPLPFGHYFYYVEAVDSSGNVGDSFGEFVFIESDSDDITPPVVSVELSNDTGTNSSDKITTDASLTGLVVDDSPVALTVEFFNVDDAVFFVGDVTDLVQPDGSFNISQARLEQISGASLNPGPYEVRVSARDLYTEGAAFLSFELDVAITAPVINSIQSDTGNSNVDGITSDTSLTLIGTAEPLAAIELTEALLGVLGSGTADADGEWSIPLSNQALVDGQYEFTAVAIAGGGETSEPSDVFEVTVDTASPLRAVFGLDPAFDTGELGDNYTTLDEVTFLGSTLPFSEVHLLNSGQTAIADSNGKFSIPNVALALGRHLYQVATFDAAGNSKVSQQRIAFDQPLTLSETGFIAEASRLVDLGWVEGSRTVSFRVDANFGNNQPNLEDVFNVYLVDPAATGTTLLDRGEPGTALFSLSGDRAEYLPGSVRFDGATVEIDVSDIAGYSQGQLLFQLIDNDNDSAAVVSISQIGSVVDPNGTSGLIGTSSLALAPGEATDVSTLSANSEIAVLLENIRYDTTTGIYAADLRVRNDGSDIGSRIAVMFDSLAGDIELLNASGNAGTPYINLRHAVPSYGLISGQVSEAVRVEFLAPTVSPFLNTPTVLDGGPNLAPVLAPIGTLNAMPGEVLTVELSAMDPDGTNFYFALSGPGDLPNVTLKASGQLVIAPSPGQIGNYQFDVIASDGLLTATQSVTLNVVADPLTTTRVSGLILDTDSTPLVGIPVELGGTQVLTGSDGSFELSFAGPLPDDTLLVRGEAFSGQEVYPFIAEKMGLLLGHAAYENVNNHIIRPIYLPALDVANGVTIDPNVDMTVTTAGIPNASVFVAAGSLEDQSGGLFADVLSITEVPIDFTPAALPSDLFPDMVVTIQPGEMVFTVPAPLNLPNLAGYLPGTEMTLWSINPMTGLFDDVGLGIVTSDGSTVETISGGIRNSSWHFFSVLGPTRYEPYPRNQNKDCDDCEEIDLPNSDAQPEGNSTSQNSNGSAEDSNEENELRFTSPWIGDPFPFGDSVSTGMFGAAHDGGWGSGGDLLMSCSADFGPYGSWNYCPDEPAAAPFHFDSNSVGSSMPTPMGNLTNANDTGIALHSGAVYKSHSLAPYQSLGVWRGLELHYDSERSDASPIFGAGFNNVQNNIPGAIVTTRLMVSRGDMAFEAPGFMGAQAGLSGGENFFAIPSGASALDTAVQIDLRSQPSGIYAIQSSTRFASNNSGRFVGAAAVAQDQLVHVNSIDSAFGSGWGLSGLTEIIENPDGSLLLVDGDGSELVFKAPLSVGGGYVSPDDDFTTLIRLGDGRFQRTFTNQTVELFSDTNKLSSVTDRNGNLTQFLYNADDNLEFIIDPVGLTTIFRYANGKVVEIEDPAGRVTALTYLNGNLVGIQDADTSTRQFGYDSLHRLTSEVDKLGSTEALRYGFSGRIEEVVRKDGTTIKYSPVQTQVLYRPEQTNSLDALVPAKDLGASVFAKRVDANGNVKRVQLDQQGQLMDARDAEGNLGEVDRNDMNLIERVVDGRGNLTIISYDSRGNIVSVSDTVSRGAMSQPIFGGSVYSVDAQVLQIVSADLNNDGFADIISENAVADSISVFLGNGSGGFGARTDFSVSNSTSLQVADVNNDGNVDVVTSNQANHISVLLGNGDGTLQSAALYATGTNPQFIEIADLNGDGFADLLTANTGDSSVSVLLGDGSGAFQVASSFSVASSPRYLAVGDLNNDGDLDVVSANDQAMNGLSILLGVGDGSFLASTFLDSPELTESVALADITGDGDLDIVTGDSNLIVLPGLGDGTFGLGQLTTTNSTNGTTWSTAVDVDLDGDLDIVFTETAIDNITVFANDGTGGLSEVQSFATPDGPYSTIVADLNLDGVSDIVTLAANADTLAPFMGRRDGTFEDPAEANSATIPVGNGPTSLDSADFNNDGHIDLVVGSQLDNSITVMLGDGAETLTPLSPIVSSGVVISVTASDVNGDGNVDLISAHLDDDILEVRLGDGTGGFGVPTTLNVSEGPRQIKVGDFNNDSELDIVAAGYRGAAEPWFSLSLNNGDGTFAPAVITSSRFEASTLDVGDINNDGNLDLVVGVSYFNNGNAIRPFLGNGDGTFVDLERTTFGGGSFGGPPRELKVVDFDGDGNLDVIGVDAPTESVRFLKGFGDGTFGAVVGYVLESAPRGIDVGDVNNDGILDVIASDFASSKVSIFLGENGGTLGGRLDFEVGDGPYGVKLIDFDEDGSLDFVVANSSDDSISLGFNSSDVSNQAALVLEYDTTFSQLSRIIDEEGRQVVFEIDPATGDMVSMTQVIGDPGGGDDIVTLYTHTPEGLIDTITDPLGRITDLDYNATGLLSKITYALGTVDEAFVSFEYGPAGNQTARIDELGHRTEILHDELNRIIRVTEADPDDAGPLTSPVTVYDYDDHGNLRQTTDALNNSALFSYDSLHRLVEVVDPDLNSIQHTYDASGNVVATTDRLGRRTEFVYDQRNRLVEIVNAEHGRRQIGYDTDNNATQVVDENGVSSVFVYDSRNRLLRSVDALGGVIRFDYDRVDNLLATTDEIGRRTRMTYDELNRQTSLQLPDPDGNGPADSPVTQFVYDKASNLRFVIDPLGNDSELVYDNRGRIVKTIEADPDGAGLLSRPTTVLTYDDANRLTTILDPLSRLVVYQYDALNRQTAVTYPDPDGAGPDIAPSMHYAYDSLDNLLSSIDTLGNETTFEYDNLNRLERMIEPDPDGPGPLLSPVTEFAYDAESQTTSMTDPLDRATRFFYDRLGRLIREELPDPDKAGPEGLPVMTYAYDAVGNELSMTDALGNVTRYEFDDLYRQVRMIEADPDGAGPETNRVTEFTYDGAHQLVSATDGLDRKTIFRHDQLGRVIERIDPDPDGAGALPAPSTVYDFDLAHNIRSMTDALGNVTSYDYDNLYRLIETVMPDPDGTGPQASPTTHYAYDSAGQLVSVVDPLNRMTTMIYDDLGRIVREILPDPDQTGPLLSPEITHQYDLMNNQVSTSDALGNTTEYGYDNLYRLVTIVEADPDGAGPLGNPTRHFTYDVASQRLSQSDPLGRTTSFTYDELGRLISVAEPDPDGTGALTSPLSFYSYDLMNNQLSMTNPLGHRTEFEYDNLYRQVKQTDEDPDGAGPLSRPVTDFEYDIMDNLSAFTDTNENRTTYEYDRLDRLTTETIELGPGNFQSRNYEYDTVGNLIRTSDRNERVTEFELDQLYRVVAERWIDEVGVELNTLNFEYDLANQLISASDVGAGANFDFVYDALGRRINTSIDNGGAIVSFERSFDANNRMTENSSTVGGVNDFLTTLGYDDLNRLTTIEQASQIGENQVADKRIEFSYNAASQMAGLTRFSDLGGTNEVSTSAYSFDGLGRLVDLTHSSSGLAFAGYGFVFDAASRITSVDSLVDGMSALAYDNIDQVTAANHDSQLDEAYEFDEVGNRTSAGYETGAYNRLNSSPDFGFEYDDEGNRTKRVNLVSGEVNEYEWDHRNRLVSVTTRATEAGPASEFVEFRYDVFNQWISTSHDSDGDGAASATKTDYVYDDGQIVFEFDDAGVMTHRYLWSPATDMLLTDERVGDSLIWAHGDHLNSVRDLVDSTGNVINHVVYDSFGNLTSQTSTTETTLFGYTGRPLDQVTGLQNNLNRWYDGSIGRWVSEDPVSFAAGDANVYRYVGNGTLNSVDPNGLEEIEQIRKAIIRTNAIAKANLAKSAYTDLRLSEGDWVGQYRVQEVNDPREKGQFAAGYRSILFHNPKTDRYVLSFVGSEAPGGFRKMIGDTAWDSVRAAANAIRGVHPDDLPKDLFSSSADWLTNASQGVGAPAKQYELAIADAARYYAIYGDRLSLTGHSLGGGLANAAALVNGICASVFNPAGVHPQTLRRHGKDYSRSQDLVDSFILAGDPLNTFQDLLPIPKANGKIHIVPSIQQSPFENLWNNHSMEPFISVLKKVMR